jgi:hypothetical protein
MTGKGSKSICECGHDEKAHEHGACRGAKLKGRGRDAKGNEYKADTMTTTMPAPQCGCPQFKPVGR